MGDFMKNNENEESIKETKTGIKKRGIVLATLTIVLIAITCIFFIYSDSKDYVMKVNDEKISISEFKKYLKWQMDYMNENSTEEIDWEMIDEESGVPNIELAKEYAVTLITETKVQLQEAKKRGITLSDKEKEFINSYVRVQLGQNEALTDYDLTTEEWVEIYQDYQIIQKLAIEICNEEFTPYDARHILLLTKDKPEEEWPKIKQKAQELLNRVLAGEDFAKLATENSEDEGSASNGGLYEGVAKGSFVTEFEDAALSLNDGEIYPELVESTYGYHIIKLEKKVSDTKITTLSDINYYNFMLIAQNWIDNAKVEKGQLFMTIK